MTTIPFHFVHAYIKMIRVGIGVCVFCCKGVFFLGGGKWSGDKRRIIYIMYSFARKDTHT